MTITTDIKQLPRLGVGIGYRHPFKGDLFLNRSAVDFLEITADHFLDGGPQAQADLQLLAEHFTLIPHGLCLSLGSAEGLNEEYLQRLANLVQQVDPPWWSEHIAFTQAGGVDIGHLTPLPFTHEALDAFCENVRRATSVIERPLILENITYHMKMPGAEMTEPEFLRAIVERTGCGLLLDVTNLYTNAVNHGYDLEDVLDALPLDAVVQLHFVGGHWDGDVLIDSHSSATPPEVWSVLQQVVERGNVKGVILERDEHIPPFAELRDELDKAKAICNRAWS